jgi:hypothetical protein
MWRSWRLRTIGKVWRVWGFCPFWHKFCCSCLCLDHMFKNNFRCKHDLTLWKQVAVAVFMYFEVLKCLLRCICYLKMYILISIGDLTSLRGFPTMPLLLISCCITTWSAILLWSSASYQTPNFGYSSISGRFAILFHSSFFSVKSFL